MVHYYNVKSNNIKQTVFIIIKITLARMRLELTTTDLAGRSITSFATEMSKMITNLPTSRWRRTIPRSDLAGEFFYRNHQHISVSIFALFG